ncbi:hypothetical protein [Campylobacter sp. RM16190]|uniref:hypothetical protein n=1 Tax=Campylobacter sp. RM16190 TaxID=1705727 RepID=UPI001475153C|nr:hypothetical protein [Campylobacter sp. RM16190]
MDTKALVAELNKAIYIAKQEDMGEFVRKYTQRLNDLSLTKMEPNEDELEIDEMMYKDKFGVFGDVACKTLYKVKSLMGFDEYEDIDEDIIDHINDFSEAVDALYLPNRLNKIYDQFLKDDGSDGSNYQNIKNQIDEIEANFDKSNLPKISREIAWSVLKIQSLISTHNFSVSLNNKSYLTGINNKFKDLKDIHKKLLASADSYRLKVLGVKEIIG